MASDYFRIDPQDGGVALLVLDRAPVNAVNAAFLQAFAAALGEIEAAGETRALVVTGEGRALSAGMDLKELQSFDAADETAMAAALNDSSLALYGLSLPVVAAANGHAIAGGLFFLLGADYRIAAQGARFGLTEVRVGVDFPLGPLAVAEAELSPQARRRLMLGGGTFDAAAAAALGIIDEIVPPEAVRDRALAVAADYARIPPRTFAAVKAQLRAPAIARARAAIAAGEDRTLRGWFTGETRAAAEAILAARKA